jgi:hypothetical protein
VDKTGARWLYAFEPRWVHAYWCAMGPQSFDAQLSDRDLDTVQARERLLRAASSGVPVVRDPLHRERFPNLQRKIVLATLFALTPLWLLALLVTLALAVLRRWPSPALAARVLAFSLLGLVLCAPLSSVTPILHLALLSWLGATTGWLACAVLARRQGKALGAAQLIAMATITLASFVLGVGVT